MDIEDTVPDLNASWNHDHPNGKTSANVARFRNSVRTSGRNGAEKGAAAHAEKARAAKVSITLVAISIQKRGEA